jgi:hypothetical protein
MQHADDPTHYILEQICYLSETIGGRGSCTTAERQAAEYVAEQMRDYAVQDVRIEPYRGAPSTYRPYALAFGAALLGTLLVWLVGGTWPTLLAVLLNAMSGGGMVAETDFVANWMRRLLPTARSQNAVGVIPAAGEVRQGVILLQCSSISYHGTPLKKSIVRPFFAHDFWHGFAKNRPALSLGRRAGFEDVLRMRERQPICRL